MKKKITNISIFLLIILFIVVQSTYYQNVINKQNIKINNLESLNDTVNYYKYQNINYFTKQTQIYNTLKQLKKNNKDLYNQLTNAKQTGVYIASTATIKLKGDTVTNTTRKVNDTTYTAVFDHKYKDDAIEQHLSLTSHIQLLNDSIAISTAIDTNTTAIKLNYSIEQTNSNYIVKAYTNSNYITINQLDGAVIIRKLPQRPQKRLSIGVFAGTGINSDILLKNIRLGHSVGIGISYRIY